MLEKLGRHVAAVQNPKKFVLIDFLLKKDSYISEQHLTMSKTIDFLLLFSQLSIGIKTAWLAVKIDIFNLDITDAGPTCDSGRAG